MDRREIKVLLRGAELRTATHEDEEHIVIPVIALVEGVIHASNASGPELVLAEEFAKSVPLWGRRPVMLNHPTVDGVPVSANEPGEGRRIGWVFNTRVDDKKLKMDAYLSEARAAKVGEEATSLLARLKDGETVEISVGVFVVSEQASGAHLGQPYTGIWREIGPDHLAMLPEGIAGACSVDMGCGAPRAASSGGGDVTIEKKTWRERFASLIESFRPSQAEEQSDADLRSQIDAALRAVEPAYLGIDAVYPDSTRVVYAVAPEDEVVLYRRSYEAGDDGVTLADDREEVKPVMSYEPVNAAATDNGSGGTTVEPTPVLEDTALNIKERVKAIIASGKTCFKDEDAPVLEQLSEERLTALEERITEPEPVPEPEPVTEPESLTEEQYLEQAPDSIKEIVAQHKTAQAKERGDLVTQLSASQKVYTKEELEALPVAQLRKLSALTAVKPRDFGGNTVPRAAAADDEGVPTPPDFHERIRASRSAN